MDVVPSLCTEPRVEIRGGDAGWGSSRFHTTASQGVFLFIEVWYIFHFYVFINVFIEYVSYISDFMIDLDCLFLVEEI